MKLTDKEGNKLMMGDDGIYLKLIGHPGTRQVISFRHGKIVKYVSKKNVFTPNKGTAMIGFNYYALKLLKEKVKTQDEILVKIGNKYKVVKIDELLNNGNFLHFLKQGFEKQLFYNLEDMNERT